MIPHQRSKRSWEIDALRGLMLVLMTLTHLPTRLTDPMGQPFGFVSAAEGFVLLSAYMAGLVYSRVAYRQGVEAMERAFWKRVFKVYAAQAAILLFLFTVITAVGLRIDHGAVRNLVSYYLAQPQEGFIYGMLLLYEPALLDILPMYIFFMLLSPWVLAWGMRHGWTGVMVASAALWAASQFGASEWLYAQAVRYLHFPLPYGEMGSFNALAWQLLWFAGLWMGASRSAPGAQPFRFPPWLLAAACALALWGLVWRHYGINGQAPFGGDEARNMLFDKWRLGPLRIVNLLALGVVVIRFGPALLVGLGISAVASLFYVIAWEISLAWRSGFDFLEFYTKYLVDGARARGATEAEVQQAIQEAKSFAKLHANPLFRMPITFIEIFPVGVLISLISAAVLRNSRVLPARAMN